jgi:hypothetical protein
MEILIGGFILLVIIGVLVREHVKAERKKAAAREHWNRWFKEYREKRISAGHTDPWGNDL